MVLDAVAVQPGDTYVVRGEPAHRELALALAEDAYAAGAAVVDLALEDPLLQRARIAHGRDEALGVVAPWTQRRWRALVSPHAALTQVFGPEQPDLLRSLPTARVAEDAARTARALRWRYGPLLDGRIRWSAMAWPTPAWARLVDPGAPEDAAVRRLERDLLDFCRLGPRDPADGSGFRLHAERLSARARALDALKLVGLQLRGAGTELELALPRAHRWEGGTMASIYGGTTLPNVPSEEVFTSPHPSGSEGTFRCSRPLVFAGRVIEGISGELRGGRLVRLRAARDEDRDLLAAGLAADRGGGRLGEVALVDRSSRIGRTGRTYFSTLLDENAASHIAFGHGIASTRRAGVPRQRGDLNRSQIHLDVMIGTDQLEVSGRTVDGRELPLIAGGDWQLDEQGGTR
jgi:aminopeptidase